MWPWRRWIEPILAAEAGDDATACLAMVLHHYRRPATLAEVHAAIHAEGFDPRPSAQAIVHAAEHFGLHGRGIKADDVSKLARLVPVVAHLVPGSFTVVVSVGRRSVELCDPYTRMFDMARDRFERQASGAYIVFERAARLPVARVT